MFSLLGFARYGLFFYMQDKNIFKLIYENETETDSTDSYNSTELNVHDAVMSNTHDLNDLSVSVEGRVADYPSYNKGNIFFLFDTENLILSGNENNLREEIKINDLIIVRLKTRSSNLLKRDEILRFNGYIEKNSYSLYLFTEEARIEKIEPLSFKDRIFHIRSKFYSCLSNIFTRSLSSSYAGLCKAVILGDTGNLSDSIEKSFKKSGIYHLIAISGQHVSFFVFIISAFLNFIINLWTGRNKRSNFIRIIFFISIIVFLFFYNFLIGSKASIVRSTFMAALVLLATTIRIEYDRKNILSMVFILTLLLSPQMFTDAGFWLSFIAVTAIIYANNIFYKLLEILCCKFKRKKFYIPDVNGFKIGKNYFIEIIITTFSVNIFIFPIMVFLFKEFSLLSFFTNVLAIPLFYVLLFILIFSSIIGLFWPPLAVFLIKSANIPVYLILKVANVWKILNFGIIKVEDFNAIMMAAYYFILITILFFLSRFVFSWYKSESKALYIL
jgi:competence protein ComEC